MPRFVVLEHDDPHLHWDFMLEDGPVLRTWRLAETPDAEGDVAAERLADHRPIYLDYEGPVSGNRGMVRRWDHGTYALVEDSSEKVAVDLAGEKLIGRATIVQGAGEWDATFRFAPG